MKKNFLRRGKNEKRCSESCGGGIYFLGFVGSAVYYIQNSDGFWSVVLAILKSLVWPALLAYKLWGL